MLNYKNYGLRNISYYLNWAAGSKKGCYTLGIPLFYDGFCKLTP